MSSNKKKLEKVKKLQTFSSRNSAISSTKVEQLLSMNIFSPLEKDKPTIIKKLCKLSMGEAYSLYLSLKKAKKLSPPFITQSYIDGVSYDSMRVQRREEYIATINELAGEAINALPADAKFCDIGCGTGLVTIAVLKNFLRKKGKVYGCDLVNYIDSSAAKQIDFIQEDGLKYLKQFPTNYFDGVMEIATLHHLKSIKEYKAYIKEIARVTKENGIIILLETTHTSWKQEMRNAILDIIDTDTTCRVLTNKTERTLPVTGQFLSDQEIVTELHNNMIKIIKSKNIKPSTAVPQLHQVYFGRKIGQPMTKKSPNRMSTSLGFSIEDKDLTLAKAYDLLLEQKHIFEIIADQVPALISYIDINERYRFTNKYYEDWVGYSNEETYGKKVKSIRGEKAYEYLSPYFKKALRGHAVTYDHTFIKQDGTPIFVNASYKPHFDKEGKVLGFFTLLIDITERKLTENKLKESEEKLNRFIEANVIGVIITDLDGQIYEANDIFLNMVGYTREELLSGDVDWLKMTPTEYLFLSEKAEQEIVSNGAATPFEKEYIRKDGSRVPVLIGDVLFDKASRKTIAFILDMTKQHELQQRKDEFIALASHELKTPLTSLKLYAQMMGQQVKRTGDTQSGDLFIKLDKQINNLNKLVKNLLDVSRLQVGKLQYAKTDFSINDLVYVTVQELQKITTSHKFITKGKVNEDIHADRDRITQVLSNLITNAVKYSPDAKKIIISLKKEQNTIQISVQDFGIGIDHKEQQKLFERYFQVDQPNQQSFSGLGLGLYLSKEIIEQHKGEIWLESEKGKGSTFYFTLPQK